MRCAPCRYGPDPVLIPMSDTDHAWLAGIVEGEGTFSRPNSQWGLVRVVMTDKDIIDRLLAVTGIGLIHAHKSRKPHHLQAWDWTVLRRANVHQLCGTLAPLLLERRRAAIKAILAANGDALPPRVAPVIGSPAAWAWLAALIDGEGWISPAPESRQQKLTIGVQSTDHDVVDQIHRLAAVGTVIALRRQEQPHYKPSWRWTVTNRLGIETVLRAVLPYLGHRRSQRVMHVLERLA